MFRSNLRTNVLFGLLTGVFVVGGTLRLSADEAKRVFLAGAATSNITPPLGELIVGGWQPIPATNIHDELHARCLVLDDGTTRLAIVLCDNVGIPVEVYDSARQQLKEATGLAGAQLLFASTHTHSATTARGPSKTAAMKKLTDYQKFLAQRISDGVQRAVANLQPARIGWGSAEEPSEVFNRRWFVNDSSLLLNPFGGMDIVRMNPPRGSSKLDRPAGPIDPEIGFLAVQSLDGKPIALLANYSLHYVGGVRKGDVSADYFGYFARFIERKLNAGDQSPPFVGMLSNGTSGDINNINFPAKSTRKYQPYEKMQEVANKVADRVDAAYQNLEFHDWVPLSAELTHLELQTRQPTPEMLAHLKDYTAKNTSDQNNDPTRRRSKEEIYAERIARIQQGPQTIQVPLQTVRIGDLGIAAIPFETFVEIGLELKDRSPFQQTFTIELANGSFGYLPTPEQHRLGGYETWLGTNYVEIEASRKIVARIIEQFQKLSHDRTAD